MTSAFLFRFLIIFPRPEPSDPTSKERGGEVERKRDTGDDTTGRGARVAPGRGWRRGGAGGKAEESRLSHPTPTLLAAPHPLPPERPLGPTARPGRAAFQTSFPPYLPIPRRTLGGEAHEAGTERRGRGAGRGGPTAPLSEPTTLKILPQVDLRKPCQLICL